MTPEGLLAELDRNGVQLSADGENSPPCAKGAVTPHLKAALAPPEPALLSLLKRRSNGHAPAYAGNRNGGPLAKEVCLYRLVLAGGRNTGRTPPQSATAKRLLSYEEMLRLAGNLAVRLRSAGVGRETVVILCVEPSPEFVVGLLGIIQAGGACLPLDCSAWAGGIEGIKNLPAMAENPVIVSRQQHVSQLAGCRGTCRLPGLTR